MAVNLPAPLLTADLAAEALGVSVSTVYAWIEAVPARLPHVRLGPRCVRFDPVELAHWIEERRQPAGEPA